MVVGLQPQGGNPAVARRQLADGEAAPVRRHDGWRGGARLTARHGEVPSNVVGLEADTALRKGGQRRAELRGLAATSRLLWRRDAVELWPWRGTGGAEQEGDGGGCREIGKQSGG
jgi:hypothetical protein